MSTYDAINAAYGAGSATDLALQYRKKAREDQYKQDVGTFTKVRLDEANQAAQDATAAQDAIVQAQAQKRIDDQNKSIDDAATSAKLAHKAKRDEAKRLLLKNGFDGTNDQLEALLDNGEAVASANDFNTLTSQIKLKKGASAVAQVKALRDLAFDPNKHFSGITSARVGEHGAVDPKLLAETYKKEIIDQRPDYQNAGDLAYLKKLHESEGDRSAIEALLPNGTDAIDVAQTAAQKRVEDQRKLEANSLTNWQRMLATSQDKSSGYANMFDINQLKREGAVADLDKKLATARSIASGHDATRKDIEYFRQKSIDARLSETLMSAVTTNPMAVLNPDFRAKLVELQRTSPAAAAQIARIAGINLVGIDAGVNRKTLSTETSITPGLSVGGFQLTGDKTGKTSELSDLSDEEIERNFGIAAPYKNGAKKLKGPKQPAGGSPMKQNPKDGKWRSIVGGVVKTYNATTGKWE